MVRYDAVDVHRPVQDGVRGGKISKPEIEMLFVVAGCRMDGLDGMMLIVTREDGYQYRIVVNTCTKRSPMS